jgi:hypothetical protein
LDANRNDLDKNMVELQKSMSAVHVRRAMGREDRGVLDASRLSFLTSRTKTSGGVEYDGRSEEEAPTWREHMSIEKDNRTMA